MNTATASAAVLKKGDRARTVATFAAASEEVTIVRAEYLNHPSYVDVDGSIVPARRERWLHVRFADGGRLLAHPSNLVPA